MHFPFDTHSGCGVAQASFGFLPVGQIDIRGDQIVLLFFLVVGLLAGSQGRTKKDSRKRYRSGMEFHGRSPSHEAAARDRRKQKEETRTFWPKRVPQAVHSTTGEAAGVGDIEVPSCGISF